MSNSLSDDETSIPRIEILDGDLSLVGDQNDQIVQLKDPNTASDLEMVDGSRSPKVSTWKEMLLVQYAKSGRG